MRMRVLGTCVAITLTGCSLLTSFSGLAGSDREPLDGAAPADAQTADGAVATGSDGSVRTDAAAAGTTLLVAGGDTAATYVSDAWTSVIKADGSLSAWQPVTALPHHCGRCDVARGPRASFFIGGTDDQDSPTKTAFRPVLGSAGLSWTPQPLLTLARWRDGATYANGFVYAFGGANYTDGDLASVELAAVADDGVTLSPWTSTTPLPVPKKGAPAAAVNQQLIVAGGTVPTDQNGSTTVLIASQATDGSLGAWTKSTDLPRGDAYGKLVAYGSRLYYVPGYAGGAPLYADVTASGLGSWVPLPSLPTTLTETEAIIVGATLYVLGGKDVNDAFTDKVYFATIAPDGSLGGWQTGTPLPAPRSFVHAAQL